MSFLKSKFPNDNPNRSWHMLKRETAFSDDRLCVYVDSIQNKRGDRGSYTLIDFSDSVVVIAEDPEQRIALVEQHRYPIGRVQRELIAGTLPRGHNLILQAEQELMEEANLTSRSISVIGSFAMQPGRAVNVGYVLHAYVDDVSPAGTDNQEAEESIMSIDFFSGQDVMDMVSTGEISGAYCLAALAIFWQSVGAD